MCTLADLVALQVPLLVSHLIGAGVGASSCAGCRAAPGEGQWLASPVLVPAGGEMPSEFSFSVYIAGCFAAATLPGGCCFSFPGSKV